jgi:hypothetical protein
MINLTNEMGEHELKAQFVELRARGCSYYKVIEGRKNMRRWVVKVVVPLVVVLFSSGCMATLSEIRTKEPYYTITSTKPPKELAKCIELKMRAQWGDRFVVNLEEYENNTYRVAFTIPSTSAIADILVKPTDSGSAVEFRRRGYLYPQYEMQEVMERCAK